MSRWFESIMVGGILVLVVVAWGAMLIMTLLFIADAVERPSFWNVSGAFLCGMVVLWGIGEYCRATPQLSKRSDSK
jgi:hypothetical protein